MPTPPNYLNPPAHRYGTARVDKQAMEASRERRVTLDSVVDGLRPSPWVILVYGPEGVGKSSLVVHLEDSITLDVEQSANWLPTKKFALPENPTLLDIHDAIDELRTREHKYRRLVIDTVARLEALIFAAVVEKVQRAQKGVTSVGDLDWGRGYQMALDEWRRLAARLDELRALRKMDILLLGHSYIRSFKNPDGPDYDRYVLRMNDKAAGFLTEWADAVLFARFDEATTKMEGSAKTKGVLSGSRSLWTQRSAAYDAKNRFNLPEQLPLDWRELEAAMKAGLTKEVA